MKKIFDWFDALPKAAKVAVMGVLVLLFFGAALWQLFGGRGGEVSEAAPENVYIELQDATVDEKDRSNLSRYAQDGRNMGAATGVEATKNYWDRIAGLDPEGGDGSSVLPTETQADRRNVELDPKKYNATEVELIRSGVLTKEYVDGQHAENERIQAEIRAEREAAERRKPKVLTQEQRDSIFDARYERALRMARSSSGAADGQAGGSSAAAAPSGPSASASGGDAVLPTVTPSGGAGRPSGADPEPQGADGERDAEGNRHIDVSSTGSQSDAWAGDGIISSLDAGGPSGTSFDRDGVTVYPAKATFLKDERVVSGQRVIMRLMQDLKLSNGVVIPANTHVSGSVSLDSRMRISVRTVQYGGKIYQADMTAYDYDGTEGIYCPASEKSAVAQAGKNVGSDIASSLVSTASSMLGGGSAVLGRGAATGIRELSRIALADGTAAVDIYAGYEFYVFENVKKK